MRLLRRHVRSFALLAAVLALPLAGCGGDSTAPSNEVLTGTWSGTVQASQTTVTLTMTITETNGAVTGTGQFNGGGAGLPVTVSGTFTSPNADLAITAEGFAASTVKGTVSGTQMKATLNGSGFVNQPITMQRQTN
jgi:hypothetical protein